MVSKLLGYVCMLAALALLGVAAYRLGGHAPAPLVFSPLQVLGATWYDYKNTYVDPTYRTVDKQRGGITTSEGQSYTMLRAVWESDQAVFDGTWDWTRHNLGRKNDHLFSWLWGTRTNGTNGVLTAQSGENTASDADTDIAMALLFAYARWQDPDYLSSARAIMSDIWDKEVAIVAGKPVLTADDLEKNSRSAWVVVNPSYMSPAAYHLFAQFDPAHPWEDLRDNTYGVLAASTNLPLDASSSARLPPDWIQMNRTTGEMVAFPNSASSSNFGFDAMRVPFRVALDWQWFGNRDAAAFLAHLAFLNDSWKGAGALSSTYSHSGAVIAGEEVPAMYGGTLGYFMQANPEAATRIYEQKLVSLYDPATASWITPLSYYDANWAWFGIALYNRLLPNLTEGLPKTAFR